MKRVGLVRRSPLRSKPRTKRAPRSTGPTVGTRVTVRARDDERCVRCGCYCGPGSHTVGQIHHRAPRRMGGSRSPYINQPANLVLLDLDCHAWVESHRTVATAQGFLLRKASHAHEVPVQAHDGWHLYLNDGSRRPVFRNDAQPFTIPTEGVTE